MQHTFKLLPFPIPALVLSVPFRLVIPIYGFHSMTYKVSYAFTEASARDANMFSSDSQKRLNEYAYAGETSAGGSESEFQRQESDSLIKPSSSEVAT